ncbi:transposase family protein [Kutzneria sp. 744]|uniref:transposase family protein n=1 Tax=Kutzneria sp. (strain 744) TaxID=345341 RepID=UPI0003EED797|nr:transposase [Kutzneria sp. 744]
MITYPATLDVPRELAQHLGRLLQAERRRRGTRTNSRALTCFWHAVLGLRWFRQNADITTLARDHGISRATGYRYLDEVITVLAAQAPDLHDALQQAKDAGATHVILDGKVFSCDRYGEKTLSVKGEPIDLWYSGKAHEHGGNIQALSAPNGFPLWVSVVEPGSVHDLTAAREHVLGALYWAASQLGLPTLADGGYDGAGIGVHTPVKQPPATRCSTRTTAPTTRSHDIRLRYRYLDEVINGPRRAGPGTCTTPSNKPRTRARLT